MKNLMTTIKKYTCIGGVFTCLFLITASCDNKEADNVLPTQTGDLLLKVNILGIDEGNSVSVAKVSSRVKKISDDNSSNLPNETIESSEAIDALMSFEQNIKPAISQITNKTGNAAKAELRDFSASVQKMTTNVRYRILVYDGSNNLVYNKEAVTGTDPQLFVNKGWQYKWYAYSINETGAVPNVDGSGKVARASLVNKDLLYASGTLTTNPGDNYLNIVFKRKTARVQVKVNARGMFGTINSGTAVSLSNKVNSTSIISIGDFNPVSNTFSNVAVSPAVVLGNNMVVDNVQEGQSVKIANFHTLNTNAIAADNLQIGFAPFSINLDDGRVRSFTNLKYTVNTGVTPSIGSSHIATIRLIESPIKVNGVYWARTNLVYNANKLDKYRLKSNPGGSNVGTKDQDFWNFMSVTPNDPNSNFDACTKVYPEGTWRMASQSEWQSLGQPQDKEERLGLFVGADYGFVWNMDSGYPIQNAYDDNRLYISFGGYRSSNGLVSGSPAGILLGAAAFGECHYWTSSSQNSQQGKAVFSSMSKLFWIFSWGGISIENKRKDEGRNVRCVRAINNATS